MEISLQGSSRKFNLLACLLTALASGSFARFHCDVCSILFFYKLKNSFATVRCSFGFHVDRNAVTAHASNERRLSASRDIRFIRTDSNNRSRPVASATVARIASFVQLQNCLVTMLSYCFCGASARTPIWASYVVTPLSRNYIFFRYDDAVFLFCGASTNTSVLGNCAVYHIGIYSYRKSSLDRCSLWKNCVFTLNQPLNSVMCSSIKCVSEPCPNDFPYFPVASELIQRRNDAK